MSHRARSKKMVSIQPMVARRVCVKPSFSRTRIDAALSASALARMLGICTMRETVVHHRVRHLGRIAMAPQPFIDAVEELELLASRNGQMPDESGERLVESLAHHPQPEIALLEQSFAGGYRIVGSLAETISSSHRKRRTPGLVQSACNAPRRRRTTRKQIAARGRKFSLQGRDRNKWCCNTRPAGTARNWECRRRAPIRASHKPGGVAVGYRVEHEQGLAAFAPFARRRASTPRQALAARAAVHLHLGEVGAVRLIVGHIDDQLHRCLQHRHRLRPPTEAPAGSDIVGHLAPERDGVRIGERVHEPDRRAASDADLSVTLGQAARACAHQRPAHGGSRFAHHRR